MPDVIDVNHAEVNFNFDNNFNHLVIEVIMIVPCNIRELLSVSNVTNPNSATYNAIIKSDINREE